MNNINMKADAVYVHIPFCRQKCLYCDFASYAGYTAEAMESYVGALCEEIALRKEEAQAVSSGATVYFGGGTPSVLPAGSIERIVAALRGAGFWREPREATIEVNPGTADLGKLQALRAMGFDRISFGVQSLKDDELRAIGRIHSAQQALEAVALAEAAGFARVSCDLIYGLPGQSMASLQDTLKRLLGTGIEHISVYGLIVEEGTPLQRLVDAGKLVLPDEDVAADMYELVQRVLREAGFTRYEISNYARNNQYSRHNRVYWQYRPYVAFGAAACGFDGSVRRTAVDNVEAYISGIQAWRLDGAATGLYTIEELSEGEQLSEYMFMGLRQTDGADLAEARRRFGVDVWNMYKTQLRKFAGSGLLIYDEKAAKLRLTEKGMELGNLIFEIFVSN